MHGIHFGSSSAAATAASQRYKPSMNQVDISFARTSDFEHVYEPDADSWLLIDSLTAEVQSGAIGRPTVALEIGCGSGAVITHLALQLNARVQDQRQQQTVWPLPSSTSSVTSCAYFATDINPRAVRLAARTAAHNRVPHIEFVQTAFVDALLPRLARAVDVLVFNPPYVPTPAEEMNGCGIERAWAGGARGREVVNVLLPQISEILSPCGVFYLITVDDNDPEEIAAILARQGLSASVVLRKKARNEKLQVMRFTRASA